MGSGKTLQSLVVWVLVAHGVNGSTGVSSVQDLGSLGTWPVVELLDRLADARQRPVDRRKLMVEANGMSDVGAEPQEFRT